MLEGSLQNLDYQDLPPEAAYEDIIKLLNAVERVRGVLVLLWHNSSFDSLWAGRGGRRFTKRRSNTLVSRMRGLPVVGRLSIGGQKGCRYAVVFKYKKEQFIALQLFQNQ